MLVLSSDLDLVSNVVSLSVACYSVQGMPDLWYELNPLYMNCLTRIDLFYMLT